MPNYCNNSLIINANPELTKKITDFVKGEDTLFDFENIIPMPDNIYRGPLSVEEEELYGKLNWYDWSIENWGTKWNADDTYLDDDITILFKTAWTPCSPVILALAKHFPDAKFEYEYYEEGCCFCGREVYENGILVYEFNGNYYCNYFTELEDSQHDEFTSQFKIIDDLLPPVDSGFRIERENIQKHTNYSTGELHYREYDHDHLYRKIDGIFWELNEKALNKAA